MIPNVFVADKAAQGYNIYLIIQISVGTCGSRCYKTYRKSTKNLGFHTFFERLGVSLKMSSISNSRCKRPSISKFLIENIQYFNSNPRFLIEILVISIEILGFSFEILDIVKVRDKRIPQLWYLAQRISDSQLAQQFSASFPLTKLDFLLLHI